MTDKLFFTVEEIKSLPKIEQHIHTNFTDGEDSPEEIVKAATDDGFKRIAFTEHVQRVSDWYKEFVGKIKKLRETYRNNIEIITGLEAKQINLKGDIDATPEQVALAEIVIGSVHGYCKDKEYEFYEFEELSDKEALQKELENTLNLIRNYQNSGINVVGHPFGVYLKFYSNPVPINYWEEIIREISNKGLAFDLNYRYHQENFKTILELAKKYQTKLNIGSDVHNISEIGKCLESLKSLIGDEAKASSSLSSRKAGLSI